MLKTVVAGAIGALIVLAAQQLVQPRTQSTVPAVQPAPTPTPCTGAPYGMSDCKVHLPAMDTPGYREWLQEQAIDRALDERGIPRR